MPKSVRVDSNATAVVAKMKANLESALGAMAVAIERNAAAKAPKRDNHLKQTGTISGNGLKRTVSFGSASVKYAAPQEVGYMTKNGRRIYFKRYTTPGTGAHYLENAGDKIVAQGIGVYLK